MSRNNLVGRQELKENEMWYDEIVASSYFFFPSASTIPRGYISHATSDSYSTPSIDPSIHTGSRNVLVTL